MWWLLIPAVLLAVIIYVITAPFFIEINSVTGTCRFRFHKLAYASLEQYKDSLFVKFKVAWWKSEYDLFSPGIKKEQHKAVQKQKRKKSRFQFRKMPQRIIAVLRSFRVMTCYITIDTGNMPANGILYPAVNLLSTGIDQPVMINFQGENEIILKIKNSTARMIWAFFTIK